MKNMDYFKNKKVTIAGLARSGIACANLLYDLGAQVSLTDNRDDSSIRLNLGKLKSKTIKVELGRHSEDFIKGRDILVVSPGIPSDAVVFLFARQFNIPVISEIEVGWILSPADVIAITGSNGKTTVTTLIGKVLEAKLKNVFVCGNIGNPFSEELHKVREGDFVSLEVSSFQLETIDKFKPKISVLLNFSRNHLDRYKDMQEYLQAKKRIFLNQDENDYLVVNGQDPVLRELVKEAKARIVYFFESPGLSLNQSAVVSVASILGIEKEFCFEVFSKFKGIEHRLEKVAEVNDIEFINDSKATTVDSAIWALKNIPRPIVLIAGGKDKGNDYSIIFDFAREKVKSAVFIGQAQEKMEAVFKDIFCVERADTLEEAVKKAYSKAEQGDCVLLSPMCASFDMFSNYEQRGRVFKEAVWKLKNKVVGHQS